MPVYNRGNPVTPMRTLGHTITLNDIDPQKHTAIFGDSDAEPSMMLKAMGEHAMTQNRKVIMIGMNTSYSGLGVGAGFRVIDLTRANTSFNIQMANIDLLANHVVTSPESFAIDIGGEEPGPAAHIAGRISAHLAIQKMLVASTLFGIDLTHVVTPTRRMGLDADAVRHINCLFGRGYDLGVQMLIAANAPSEIPIEYNRATLQCLTTKLSGNSVDTFTKLVKRPAISDERDSDGHGLSNTDKKDYFYFPMTADPFSPYYIELPALMSDAGNQDQDGRKIDLITVKFISQYRKAEAAAAAKALHQQIDERAKAKLEKAIIEAESNHIAHKELERLGYARKPAGASVTLRGERLQMTNVSKSKFNAKQAEMTFTTPALTAILAGMGLGRPNCRARLVFAEAAATDPGMTIDHAATLAATNRVGQAVLLGSRLYENGVMNKKEAWRFMFSCLRQNADLANGFCQALVNESRQAGNKVLDNNEDDNARFDRLTSAWVRYLEVNLTVANDDRQAAVAA